MSKKVLYADARDNGRPLEITIMGKTYEGMLYEDEWFGDTVPNGVYDYFLRHDEDDFGRPFAVKKSKGFTVNFLGTFATNEPIDFGYAEEFYIEDFNFVND